MTFEEAMAMLSNIIDDFAAEVGEYGTEEDIKCFDEIAEAEGLLYLLVTKLKKKGITNLKDLKDMEKVQFVTAAFN